MTTKSIRSAVLILMFPVKVRWNIQKIMLLKSLRGPLLKMVANTWISLAIREVNPIEYHRDNGNYDSKYCNHQPGLLSKKDSGRGRIMGYKRHPPFWNEDTVNSIKAFKTAINISSLPEITHPARHLCMHKQNPKSLIMIADALIIGNQAKAQREAKYLLRGSITLIPAVSSA